MIVTTETAVAPAAPSANEAMESTPMEITTENVAGDETKNESKQKSPPTSRKRTYAEMTKNDDDSKSEESNKSKGSLSKGSVKICKLENGTKVATDFA